MTIAPLRTIPLLLLLSAGALAEPLADPAQRDPRVREYLSAKRIVWKSDATGVYVTNADHLLKAGTGQAELFAKDVTAFKSDAQHTAGVLVDFGKEIHGGVSLVTGMWESKKPVRVRIRFGESATEAMSELDGPTGATNDHAIRDYTVALPWLGQIDIGLTGFRFVRIDLLDSGAELLLKEMRAVFVFRDLPYVGSFHSSDERLDRIWLTGAYTVHLNMQQYLWDGIKRDRLVWVGDLHPEIMTINSVFGAQPIVPASLDLIRDATPLPAYMNGISSYSMWWILIQRDWYLYQGDLQYLREQAPYLKNLLTLLMSKTSGGRERLDGWRFLDWSTEGKEGAVEAGLQAMMVLALGAGAELSEILEDRATAEACRKVVASLKRNMPDAKGNKQATALQALAAMLPAKRADEVLSASGVQGFSTFYGYYILRAKALAGDYDGAMRDIREYWGGMLDLGATTFWEDFDIAWMKDAGRIDELVPPGKTDVHASYGSHAFKKLRMSLAHGWASGPTSWLTQYVLGINVIEPGAKAVRIAPHLGDLEFAEGTFPTPHGVIKVKHTKSADGEVVSDIDAPAAIRIVLEGARRRD